MPKPKLGIQTYTVRAAFDRDMGATLRALKGWGCEGVELWSAQYGLKPEAIAEEARAAGLELAGWHTTAEMLMDEFPRVIDHNRRAGNRTVILYRLPPMMSYSLDAVKAAAGWLNETAARLADAGLVFGFHNYGPDTFRPLGGVTVWDYLNERCDERFIMELDVCTAAMADADIPALMRRAGKRLYATHIKPYTYGYDDRDDGMAPMIGEDSLDYDAIRVAGLETGVTWHLAEYESAERYTPLYAAELCIRRLKEKGY